MAEQLTIQRGTRMRAALDRGIGQEPQFDWMCTFYREVDDNAFLVSIPMVNGKSIAVEESQRLLFRIQTDENGLIVAGYVDEVVQEGLRRYWKVRRTGNMRAFQQRRDERYRVALPVHYMKESRSCSPDGKVRTEEGMTADISYGGVALYLHDRFEVGELCHVALPPLQGINQSKEAPELVGMVCWQREAPDGYRYRYLCGLQFRFVRDADREALVEYVDYLKIKYAL